MIFSIYLIYGILFTFLTWKRFSWGVYILITTLPAYLIRFSVGPLPSTLLELNFGILFLVWLVKYSRADISRIAYRVSHNRLFFIFSLLFFISSLAGIFISDQWYISLGQWRAYFLEPMLVFIILVGRLSPTVISSEAKRREKSSSPTITPARSLVGASLARDDSEKNRVTVNDLIFALLLSCLPIDIFGIAQYVTGWHIGNVDWIALQTHRVTSLFLSPNAVALYLVPITLLVFAALEQIPSYKPQHQKKVFYLIIGIAILNLTTIFLCRSLGGWVALFIGALMYGFINNYKKVSIALVTVVLILGGLFVLDGKLAASKSQSAANRLTLWSYTQEFLTKSPKNFVLGAGIRQFFRKVQKPYYDDKKMERLIYPHNIFLNFWSEIGLFGMLAFAGLLCTLSLIAYRISKHNKVLGASLLAAVLSILVHGLIDVPYFKNDLAMLFWLLSAIIISSNYQAANKNKLNG